jgi:hypothetical protein
VLCVISLACSSTNSGEIQSNRCPIPTGFDLDKAIDQGIRTVRDCNERYDEVYEALLEIAASDGDPENKTKLYRFARTLVDEKVVPADRTRESFRQYFDTDFVSIPDSSISVAVQCGSSDDLKEAMRAELEKKEVGLRWVMGDEEGFAHVTKSYTRFVDAMDIVCSTFNDDSVDW